MIHHTLDQRQQQVDKNRNVLHKTFLYTHRPGVVQINDTHNHVMMNMTRSLKAQCVARSELIVRVHASEAFLEMKPQVPLE